jgi:peptidoglycan/LPS O-acetylase OafA/YrhL
LTDERACEKVPTRMQELLPLIVGACTGWVAGGLRPSRARVVLVLVVAVAVGLVASVASGEFADSWLFAVWDASQALVAGTLIAVLRSRQRTRATRERV